MRSSRLARLLLLAISSFIVSSARPQQPFDLDTNFRTEVNTWYVSSIAPLPDGRVFISGMINYPEDFPGVFRGAGILLPNGQRDLSFPNFPYTTGAGKVTPWNGQYYVATTQTVRRLNADGLIDPLFIQMNFGPYFSSLQGGDYHVYPDGRILMSGVHQLSDSIRGYEGYYCLVWFNNTGYLDTTAHHRTCSGSLDVFSELPDGKFIGSLGTPPGTATWDNRSTSNIMRFAADGALDTTFQTNVWWGQAFAFLPLPDGRVYAGGHFRITGIVDTLQLVRFMPDGSLDPSFNNQLAFSPGDLDGSDPGPTCIHPLNDGHLIITGGFQAVDGQQRGGICMLDTNGVLRTDQFTGSGGGSYLYQGLSTGTVRGIIPGPNDDWYIWGSYHGYDDGTNNDTLQRMVSRLYGLNVGIGDLDQDLPTLALGPNPGTDNLLVEVSAAFQDGSLRIRDLSGRVVMTASLGNLRSLINTSPLSSGLYVISVNSVYGSVTSKWIKQ